jgi:hypothetical protein
LLRSLWLPANLSKTVAGTFTGEGDSSVSQHPHSFSPSIVYTALPAVYAQTFPGDSFIISLTISHAQASTTVLFNFGPQHELHYSALYILLTRTTYIAQVQTTVRHLLIPIISTCAKEAPPPSTASHSSCSDQLLLLHQLRCDVSVCELLAAEYPLMLSEGLLRLDALSANSQDNMCRNMAISESCGCSPHVSPYCPLVANATPQTLRTS